MKKFNLLLLVFISFIVFSFIGCNPMNAENQKKEETLFDVVFDSAYGSVVETQKIVAGQKVKIPNNPIREGTGTVEYIFDGWFYCERLWDFENDVVNQDMKLVAHWYKQTYTGDINIRR